MSERKLAPIVESHNIEEEYLYAKPYIFIKGFATNGKFVYTLKALPLARKFHNGQYRKGLVEVDGKMVKLPYILHCLKVCSTLISLELPLSNEDLDILYASALLHDSIEDAERFFPKGGIELVNEYSFPKEVYNIVKLLSKHAGSDEYELNEYFNNIKKNRLALLIKLADRSHNVEDLYSMKIEKLHKYVNETRTYIYALAKYAKESYPELSNGITILKAKIVSLTELTETLVEMHEEIIKDKNSEIEALKKEIEDLKKR